MADPASALMSSGLPAAEAGPARRRRLRARWVVGSAVAAVVMAVVAGSLLLVVYLGAGRNALLDHARAFVFVACALALVAAGVAGRQLLRPSRYRWLAAAALVPQVLIFAAGWYLLTARHEDQMFADIVRGSEPGVRRALAWGVSPEALNDWSTSEGNEGASALTTAARAGRLPVVRLLLARGADPNRADGYGHLPLHRAVGAGHEQVVRLLLDHRADPRAKDLYGDTALHWAASRARVELIDRLVDIGLDVNARGYGGATPLHKVSSTRDLAATGRLLLRGADRSLRDDEGQTAADLARRGLADRENYLRTIGRPEAREDWATVRLRKMIELLEEPKGEVPAN
jgi:hypothetical protein